MKCAAELGRMQIFLKGIYRGSGIATEEPRSTAAAAGIMLRELMCHKEALAFMLAAQKLQQLFFPMLIFCIDQ